jgi:HlyD family secretion protein/epimerase transport system membrane fusion protein
LVLFFRKEHPSFLKDTPVQHAILTGLATLAIFFGGFGSWAALAPLDGAITGTGQLEVRGNRKTVQHREGGIVAALLVQEGDRVKQGQILVRLDDTQILANLHVHQAALDADLALSARDLAEITDAATISFPASLSPSDPVAASVMAREASVFRNHRALLTQELAVVDERIAQSRQQQEGARAQYAAGQRGLSLAQQELTAFQDLAKTGLASHTHVLELARNVEQLRGEVGQLQTEIAQHAAEADELAYEKLRLRATAQSDATHELREAQLRINDVTPRIAADRDMLARLDIRAPVSGQVVDQTVFTKGGIIEPGKPILDIVPNAPKIIAEADFRPEDIEHLHVGQAARVIATGFNPRETQAMQGRLAVISADRITDPHNGQAYYKAEIAIEADREGGALLKRLTPGMPIEVIVPVKPRTALDYLTEPLRSSFRKAGNEM